MKLHNLTLENFRSFDRYTVNHLGRINLLVGTNNSGKTSILEAVYLLMSSQPSVTIWNLLFRRGEVLPKEGQGQTTVPTEWRGDIRHLLKGRTLSEGRSFKLSGQSDSGFSETQAQITYDGPGRMADGLASAFTPSTFDSTGFGVPTIMLSAPPASLIVTTTVSSGPGNGRKPDVEITRLDLGGGLSLAHLRSSPTASQPGKINHVPHFVDTSSMINSRSISRNYNDIILTSEENLILETLRSISPEIERIAPVWEGSGWPDLPARDGIYVKLAGIEDRVPLGSMGDGIWRMLGLALAVVHSRDKILLIDEIDTGLHHSVMSKMWRFLDECSKRFNVQIIATTHSRDCYQSLAEICDAERKDPSEITMQRIDRKRGETVAYSEAAIIAAAENDVEVR